MRRIKSFFSRLFFHPEPGKRNIITLVYCGVGIIVNFFCLQVFCMPVVYAAAMCLLFFWAILYTPFATTEWIRKLCYFALGTGVPICLYLVLFLADPATGFVNYLAFLALIILFGAGLLAFIPFYLLWHIRCFYKGADRMGRRLIWAGIVVPLLCLSVYLVAFRVHMRQWSQLERKSVNVDEFIQRLPASYFTERVLGLHWKYHTRLEYVYDGWRPPLHDPFLVVALWSYPVIFPDSSPVFRIRYNEDAIRYYGRKFPDKPLQVWCPCSWSPDGRSYGGLDSVVPVHLYPNGDTISGGTHR